MELETVNVTVSSFTPYPEGWILVTQIWASILCLVGTTGNLLTLLVFIFQMFLARTRRGRRQVGGGIGSGSTYSRNQRLTLENVQWQPTIRLTSYVLLLSHLSFCDLLYCAINLPLTTLTYTYALDPNYKFSQRFCTGAALMRYIIASVEWMTLGILALKRCMDINRARNAQLLRPKTAGCVLVAIWLASISFHSIPAFKGQFGYSNSTYKCVMTDRTIKLIFFTAEFSVPCGLMLIGCVSLVYQIWRNVEQLRLSDATADMVRDRFRSLIKSTMLVLCLMFLFLICVTPICVFSIHMILSEQVNVPLGIFLYMVYWVQYAVNFIVYAASNELYRRACRQSFLLIWKEFQKWFRSRCRTRGQATRDVELAVSTITDSRVARPTSSILATLDNSSQRPFESVSECDNTFASARPTCCCGALEDCSSRSCLSLCTTTMITRL